MDQTNTVDACHGLMVYVCNTQVVSHAIRYPGHNIEAIKLVLEHGMNQLCVIAIYSSPQTQATELYTTLHEILIECDNVPVIIIGNFNIQTPKDNTNPLCNYMKVVYKCNQYVNKSTTKYNTNIDLVFSNLSNLTVGTIDCYWSDHKMVYTVI